MDQIKIATLNLCLGLKNKKDLVKDILCENSVDILLMQETEIDNGFDCRLLSIPGYVLEIEEKCNKKRVGFYIKDSIKYQRRSEFEEKNCHIIVIDIQSKTKNVKRLINVYRSFNTEGNSANNMFIKQLDLIKRAFENNTVMMGDFNLDFNKISDINYTHANLFDEFELRLGPLKLAQLVNFDTWSRVVGTILRSSCLDHIYVNDIGLVNNVTHLLLLIREEL